MLHEDEHTTTADEVYEEVLTPEEYTAIQQFLRAWAPKPRPRPRRKATPIDRLWHTCNSAMDMYPFLQVTAVPDDEMVARWRRATHAGKRRKPAGTVLVTTEPSSLGCRLFLNLAPVSASAADIAILRHAFMIAVPYANSRGWRRAHWSVLRVGDTSELALVRHRTRGLRTLVLYF